MNLKAIKLKPKTILIAFSSACLILIIVVLCIFLPKACSNQNSGIDYSVYELLYNKCLAIINERESVEASKLISFRYNETNNIFSFSAIDNDNNQYIYTLNNTGYQFNEDGIKCFINETNFRDVDREALRGSVITTKPYIDTFDTKSIYLCSCNKIGDTNIGYLSATIYEPNNTIHSILMAEYIDGNNAITESRNKPTIDYKKQDGMIYTMNEYLLLRGNQS